MLRCIISALIWVLVGSLTVFGQVGKGGCNCPKTMYAGTKAETTFHFFNGKTIVLCGYKNPKSVPVNYSEFVLAVCGQPAIIGFWGAVTTCRLRMNNDTLLVEQLVGLPTGVKRKSQLSVWSVEKIYFRDKKVLRKWMLNRKLPKYNQAEIASVLKAFGNARGELDEAKMDLAAELLVAAISGSGKARECFGKFKTRFGVLDGHFAETYEDLREMLALWDKK